MCHIPTCTRTGRVYTRTVELLRIRYQYEYIIIMVLVRGIGTYYTPYLV